MPPLYVDTDELLAGPFYAFGAMLIGLPMLDFATSILPLHPGDLQWRFATLGLLSNFLMTPMMGIGVWIAVAGIREHRGFQRGLAVLNAILCLTLGWLVVVFFLDVIQLNASMPPEQAKTFQTAAGKALIKHAFSLFVLLWMTTAGWRVSSMRTGAPAADRRVVR